MIVNNSTRSVIYHQHRHYHKIESINEPTAITEITSTHYDSAGAAIFIVVVLLWYSIGIFCTLGMQIRARSETIEDCARRRAKLFIQTLRDQTQKKEILEELADKQKREKLWNIYFEKTETNTDKLKRAELVRIRNIEKQLAVISRNRMIMNETVVTPVINHFIRQTSLDSRSTLISDVSSIGNQVRERRRSSFDQQILERWKSIVDQSKTFEQFPWPIRKKQICRHFRRSYKNPSKELKTTEIPLNDSLLNHEPIDDDQTHLLPTQTSIDLRTRPLTKKSNELLNPYITYFHLPIYENSPTNIQNLPLVTIKSDHHIIQFNDDEC